MSAFIVSDKTIAGMLQATGYVRYGITTLYYWQDKRVDTSDISRMAQVLIAENYRSVNHRYDERAIGHEYSNPSIKSLEPVEIVKLCHCYAYQACETNDWKDTEAYALCDALEEIAIRALPGYENAQWGL